MKSRTKTRRRSSFSVEEANRFAHLCYCAADLRGRLSCHAGSAPPSSKKASSPCPKAKRQEREARQLMRSQRGSASLPGRAQRGRAPAWPCRAEDGEACGKAAPDRGRRRGGWRALSSPPQPSTLLFAMAAPAAQLIFRRASRSTPWPRASAIETMRAISATASLNIVRRGCEREREKEKAPPRRRLRCRG